MNPLRLRFAAWLLATAALTAFFFGRVIPGLHVETDITAMLPQVAQDAETDKALRGVADRAGRHTLFLVGANDFAIARKAAHALADSLSASGAFINLQLEINTDPARIDGAYGDARKVLLSDRDRALLQAGKGEQLADEALHALYSPAGMARARPFGEDPLNLYGDFLAQLIPAMGKLQLREGVLSASRDGIDYVMVTAEVAGNPFAIDAQNKAEPALQQAYASAKSIGPQIRILCSGVLQHAIANSDRATNEISAFGSVSMLGVVLVLVLTFRSWRPLALSLLSLAVGTMAATTTCYLLFKDIHLVALVFGSSLLGVGVDYSLHFFADQFRQPESWSGAEGLKHVGPAVSVGVLTTALGYLALLVPPFPGLRQMAVLSVAGVAATALCVLGAYPLLAGRGRAAPKRVHGWMQKLAHVHRPAHLRWIALALVIATAAGLWRLHFIDDIRALQSSPAELIQQEREARELLGGGLDSRFFMVEGANAEAVLQTEETLRGKLDALIQQNKLSGYTALSRAVPSQQRQKQNEQWLQQQVYAENGALAHLLTTVGYGSTQSERARAAFVSQMGHYVVPEDWLKSEAGAAYRALWIGKTTQGAASVVALNGVHDVVALSALDDSIPGVRFVDRVASISNVLSHYRVMALWALALVLSAIACVLCLRYGWRDARRHIVAPLGGVLLTLATLGLLGIAANLFTVLALLLVLGMGVDYTVFLEEGSESRSTTLLAITLAGVATLLSFGMLAGSSTPFIASLGLAVLLGVSYTWLLALLASAPANRDNLSIPAGVKR